MDQEVLSFLQQIRLTKLIPLFQEEEMSMRDVLKLNHESLKAMGVQKQKDRQRLYEEIEKLRAATSSTTMSRYESSVYTTKDQFGKKYKKVAVIGTGAFGRAWKVKLRHGSGEFIMKEIYCSPEDVLKGRKEIDFLKKCRHGSIVSYIEDFYEQNMFLIIMEFCSGGDLAKFIDSQQHLLEVDFIMDWVEQLASGVSFIHKKKIIHRDLKPANIFLTFDKNLKIGDFGVAKGLDRTSGLASTFAGTIVYIAPEIHGGEKYDNTADLWSLGCIIFEIATLKKAFLGKDFFQAICKE